MENDDNIDETLSAANEAVNTLAKTLADWKTLTDEKFRRLNDMDRDHSGD